MRKIRIEFRSEACCYQNVAAVIEVPSDATRKEVDKIVERYVLEKLISFSWVSAHEGDAVGDFYVVEEDR